jgi:hypothetical protein
MATRGGGDVESQQPKIADAAKAGPAAAAKPDIASSDKRSAHVGGKFNYFLLSFDLFIAWAGWTIIVGALSALQRYTNRSSSSNRNSVVNPPQGPNNAQSTAFGWAVNANYPYLQPGRVFRLDWFITFYIFIVLCLVTFAVCSNVMRQSRAMLVGYLAVAAVLAIIDADRFYNVSHFVAGSNFSAARGTFAGFCITAVGIFGLMYLLGLEY